MANEVNVGTIAGKVELDAASVSATLGDINTKLDLLAQKSGQASVGAKEVAEGFIGAETALRTFEKAAELAKDELQELFIGGSKEAGIKDAFEHLTEQAGLYGDVLTQKVKTAVRGTIEDTDIQKRINADLAAGLKLTTEQYEMIADASFKLAKAEGIDVKDAFDRVSDAMVTGRTRGVALLTGRIDQVEAERKYAESIGTTADMLNQEGKIEAARKAILEGLAGAQQRLGDAQTSLADKLQAGVVMLKDFNSDLGIAVAQSPVFSAALDEISNAFGDAFGDNKEELIKQITSGIEEGAIYVADFGVAFAATADGVVGAGGVLVGVMQEFLGSLLAIYDFAHGNFQAAKADLITGFKTIADSVTGNTGLQQGIEKIEGALMKTRDAMVLAKEKADLEREAVTDVGEEHAKTSAKVAEHAAQEDKLNQTYAQTPDQIKKAAAAMKEMQEIGASWRETIQGIDGDTVEAVKYYLQAGIAADKLAAAYQLTDAQMQAIQNDLKATNAGFQLLNSLVEKERESEDKLAQVRRDAQQSSLKRTLDEDTAALQDKYQRGLISEQQYQQQIYAVREEYARKSEALYREDASAQEAAIDDKMQHELAALQEQYNQGKLSTEDYEKARTLIAQNGAAERQAIEDKYNSDRLDRLDANNEAEAASFDQVGQGGKHAYQIIGEAAAEFGSDMDNVDKKVLTLNGDLVDAVNYKKQLDAGGSFTYDLTTREGVEQYKQLNPAARISWSDEQIMEFAKKGGTLQQLVNSGVINPYGGYASNMPHFAEGGYGDFGSGTVAMLHGREIITPIDKVGGNIGGNITNHFYVNGTGDQVARQVSDTLMRQLKMIRKFGSA